MRLPLLAVFLLFGCATPLPRGDLVLRSVAQPEEPGAVPGATYLVKVLGDPQLDGEVRVSAEGTVPFPLCGPVKVLGSTVRELETKLHDCLAPWLRDPAVSVRVVDSGQAVVLLGDLPGRVKWEPRLTLISLLLQVGGEGIGREVDVVQITRGQRHAFVSTKAIATGESPNVALEPGDLVRIECRGCTARPAPSPPAKPASATSTAVLAMEVPKCAAGSVGCAGRVDLARVIEEVLRTADLAPRDVRISSNETGTVLEVTSVTPGEAQARCTALVLATRAALPLQADPARQWAQTELLHTREQLATLGDSLRTLPHDGRCADETTIPALKACVQTRLFALGALSPETKDCTEGLMCTVAAKWFDARRQVSELSSRYGPEHPTLRAASEQRDELQKWFERQRKTELAALTALIARLPKASSAQNARLENVLAQLERPTFDLADGVAEDLPVLLRGLALEYQTVALKRAGLLSRFLEKHPQVVAIDARLSSLRDTARKVVPVEVELLRDRLAHPKAAAEDPRLREALRQRENLLRVHELLDRVGAPPELTVVQPCL